MAVPPSLPQVPGRSRKRHFAPLAAGLGLVALAAVYLVVQLIRDDAPSLETDFSKDTCEDFDLAEFEAFSAGEAELSSANAGKFPDTESHGLYCEYTSDSGMTLKIGASLDDADEDPAIGLDDIRQVWELDPSNTVEDFDNGDLAGFTRSSATETEQIFNLYGTAAQLSIGVFLRSELGGFEAPDALALTEAMAAQVFERFEAYA